ncbi:MAG TPA: zinc-ribbon domain-containing protein [Blastocatellia bacterium]|nr:zinc-ribbon domain-containing protein [Blastocatellia bacterium]
MNQCPRCGASVNPNAKFCPICALNLSEAAAAETQVMPSPQCPNCGSLVAPGARFCPNCASPIAAGAGQGAAFGGGYNAAQAGPYYGGQGYAPEPRAKSSMPVIIGAVVLLVLIGAGIAAYFIWFNKPSGSNSNSNTSGGSTSKAPSQSPGDSMKKLISALESGDRATVRSLVAKSEGESAVDELFRDAADDMRRAGGVDTVSINKEDVNGDTATVQFEVKYRNGKSDRDTVRLIKEDGVWKLTDLR